MKMTFSHAPKKKKTHGIYVDASGAYYIRSSCGKWFRFDTTGRIQECFGVVEGGWGYTPVEGPLTITINPDD